MIESLSRRIAAHRSWALTPDRTARTAPGRAALDAKIAAEIPDTITDPVVRARAIESARKAYFLRLAQRSAETRRRKAAERTPAESA